MILAVAAGCQPALQGAVTPAMQGEPGWALVKGVPLEKQKGPADCGIAALAMVVRYWQPSAKFDEVRDVLPTKPEEPGIAAGRLREVARGRGLSAYLVEGELGDLDHEIGRGRPVIVGLVRRDGRRALNHYVVVTGINKARQTVLTADPQRGWREVPLAEFTSEWDPARRLLLVVFPPGA